MKLDNTKKEGENKKRRGELGTEGERQPRPHPSPVSQGSPRPPFHPPALRAYPFQIEAARFALSRSKSYLALDPGLGKTIVAALILNQLPGATAFYVCPPFLTSNTQAEFKKWCFDPRLVLIPDSRLTKPETLRALFAAINGTAGKKILFIDEAHRFKNEKAQRTRALFQKIYSKFDRVVFMSGTPLPNSRPIELWPILHNVRPIAFQGMSFFQFAKRFCGAFRGPFGWDFSGFTNRKEFKDRLTSSFMIRIKKDVLTLPPKREGLLTVGKNLPAMVSSLEKRILKHYSPEDLIRGKIGAEGEHLSTYLRLLGKHKLKYVIPYVESLLEETRENLLIFTLHRDVLTGLAETFKEYRPLVISGDTPSKDRQGIVKEFSENVDRRIFLGNIRACGVGFTINKASRVLFVEFSWTDGENVQAADRAHRIGQDKSILVQYVVLAGSIDRARMETLLRKREKSL